MKQLFKIGFKLPSKTVLMIEIGGLLFFILLWFLLTFPRKSQMIQFRSENTTQAIYKWKDSSGKIVEFNGDNILTDVKTGNYEVTFSDSGKCEQKQTITVPETIKDNNLQEFKSTCTGKNGEIILYSFEVKSTNDGFISKAILPTPLSVVTAYRELLSKDFFLYETAWSFFINFLGYLEAIVLSIMLGFAIGLIPFMRGLLNRWVNAVRFIPLTAVTGLFIAWFGIETNMKVQFLAFGIFVYLLPVVVQRIDEIEKIYLQTAFTLGANSWQQIRYIYWPHVSSKIIDDVRVLTAISWTYIIIAEMLNQTGGIGSLIHLAGRQSRLDKVFALLLVIVLIGIIQDRIFVWLDKVLFPHKKK